MRAEHQSSFVGRVKELTTFERALTLPSPTLLFVTGQVGAGKSALLLAFQRLALASGHDTVLLSTGPVYGPLRSRTVRSRLNQLRQPQAKTSGRRRRVLLVDGFERTTSDQAWFLSELLPAIADDVLLVLASRNRQLGQALSDPAWARLTQRVELSPLSKPEAQELLEFRCVPTGLHQSLFELSAGFPLTLTTAADLLAEATTKRLTVDLLQQVEHTLAAQLSPGPLSATQQLALDICSLVRTTNAELLEHAARSAAPSAALDGLDAFDWLMRQSFMDWTPLGLEPHHQVRLALHAQLRRERPRRYRMLRRAAREFYTTEMETGENPDAAARNLLFLNRETAAVRSLIVAEPATPTRILHPASVEEHPEIVELVRETEGHAAATLAEAYLREDGESFELARNESLEALLHYTVLNAESWASRLSRVDPLNLAVRRFLLEHPLMGEEEAILSRWSFDRRLYQTPSTPVFAITARHSQLVLSKKHVVYSFCALRDVEPWVALWKNAAVPWQVVARYSQDGHEYSLVTFSWKRRALRDVLLHHGRPDERDSGVERPPSFDELRVKVRERVAELASKIKLTPREVEILEQLCLGTSLEDISRQLAIRPRTVKFHQENLLRKTGASSRVELFRKLI